MVSEVLDKSNRADRPILLIFGNSTSGKTTLGHSLVENGFYDAYVEVDDIWRWVSGDEKRPWRHDHPDVDKNRKLKNRIASLILPALKKGGLDVCANIWPGESQPVLERLQTYEVVVLKGAPLDEAKERFTGRGQTLEDWDLAFPEGSYEKNERRIGEFAAKMEERGRTIDPATLPISDWFAFYHGDDVPTEDDEDV